MTTVHRTKGLEYDYVFIPDCTEGYMPVHIADDVSIWDKSGEVPEHPSSPPLESERRLFYVAITRAKKHLYIGTIIPPQHGQQFQSTSPLSSRFLEEMRLSPTEMLVKAIQQLLQTGTQDSLAATIKEWQEHKDIITYLVQQYIPQALSTRLLQPLATVAESQFQYAYAYPGLETAVQRKPEVYDVPPQPELDEIWNFKDPWESIR